MIAWLLSVSDTLYVELENKYIIHFMVMSCDVMAYLHSEYVHMDVNQSPLVCN